MHSSPFATNFRGSPVRRGKSPRFSSDNLALPSSSAFPINFTNKPATTFISSLDIPVQGAIPIDSDTQKKSGLTDARLSSSADSKRAPRKSKTDALAALNNHARSPSIETDFSEDIAEKYKNGPPISVTSFLDLSSVKTPLPRSAKEFPRPPRPSRPFELTDCPEFFPTVEEFKDPMSYIKSISPQASAYGICKIIPPDDWRMPFVTDTEVCLLLSFFLNSSSRLISNQNFRFKTRLQRLNSIEASSRAKLNFLEQLYRFHKQQGNPRVFVPTINHKPIDLWLLRKEVQKLGGYDAVS